MLADVGDGRAVIPEECSTFSPGTNMEDQRASAVLSSLALMRELRFEPRGVPLPGWGSMPDAEGEGVLVLECVLIPIVSNRPARALRF